MVGTILIVEDDLSALRLIEFTLEQEGYKVVVATNGLEGLQRAQEEKPDLIILDLMLPGLDGFSVCQRIRENYDTANIPIIILSAKTHESDTAMAAEVGADAYLTKPADPSEVVSQVQSLLTNKSILL